MNKKLKQAGIAVAISSVAVLISVVNIVVGGFSGSSIPMFCGMIAVFCSCLTIYAAQKKKENNEDNQ